MHDATCDLLRQLGLTIVFGNQGSVEENFLGNFSADFTCVLGLREAALLAMADGHGPAGAGVPAYYCRHRQRARQPDGGLSEQDST